MINMKFLFISIIESIYIIYMFNYFKTKYNIAHPITYFNNTILYHPIGKQPIEDNLICPLGNIGSYVIGFYLIGRNFIPNKYWNKWNKWIIIMILISTLINFNATLYFFPIVMIELLYLI